MANPTDLVGPYIGQSELNTRAVLSGSKGKVLVIDEAYMLDPRRGAGSELCPFRTAAIDTIIAEVQGTPGKIFACCY